MTHVMRGLVAAVLHCSEASGPPASPASSSAVPAAAPAAAPAPTSRGAPAPSSAPSSAAPSARRWRHPLPDDFLQVRRRARVTLYLMLWELTSRGSCSRVPAQVPGGAPQAMGDEALAQMMSDELFMASLRADPEILNYLDAGTGARVHAGGFCHGLWTVTMWTPVG